MAPPIGGMGGGMGAMSAMLARTPPGGANGNGGQAGPPPNGGPPGMNAAAGMDAQGNQQVQFMRQVFALGEEVKMLGAANPLVADLAEQVQLLLKQMVVVSANAAPVQTMSSAAVPTGATA